jgi:hypothetical protein
MKPIEFKYQNVVFAKDQPEYQPLPALRIEGPEGHVISCWRMSFKERVKVLFTGVVWLNLMSFNKPLTPSLLTTNRKEVFSIPSDSIPFLFLWKNKEKAGSWLAIHWGKSAVYFHWYIKLNLKYKQWFAYIHLPLLCFAHNNSVTSFGLCFGKYFIELYHNR